MKEINKKKGFIFIKNKDKDVIMEIKDYFEDPNLFLKDNSQIGIGKASLSQKTSNINNNNYDINSVPRDINSDMGINLSIIPNLSLNQKSINSIEDNNNPLNIKNEDEDINNNEQSKSKFFNICFSDKKTGSQTIKKEKNDYFIIKQNKKQKYCDRKNSAYNNLKYLKRKNRVTAAINNGKLNKNGVSNKYRKILLLCQKKENRNKDNLNYKEIRNKRKKIDIKCSINNQKRPLSVGIHYRYKSPEEILKSYFVGKEREDKSKAKGTDYFLPKEVDEKIKREYLSQEKYLKKNNIHNYKDKKISFYLSQKCHKKEENLLYNNIEDFRIKKQLLDYLENNKNLSEKIGEKYWYVNLRRPDFIKSARGLFINVGNEEKNIWEPIVDLPMNNLEIIKRPETPYKENNNFEKFLKDKYLYPKKIFNQNLNGRRNNAKIRMPNLTEINNMVIKGKNIISFEKENFLTYNEKENITKRKFKVYKDPREDNLKYSNDCLYKLDYKYEGLSSKTKSETLTNKKFLTPKEKKKKDKIIYKFHSNYKNHINNIKEENKN